MSNLFFLLDVFVFHDVKREVNKWFLLSTCSCLIVFRGKWVSDSCCFSYSCFIVFEGKWVSDSCCLMYSCLIVFKGKKVSRSCCFTFSCLIVFEGKLVSHCCCCVYSYFMISHKESVSDFLLLYVFVFHDAYRKDSRPSLPLDHSRFESPHNWITP